MKNNVCPTSHIVEGNAELVMKEFYGANDVVTKVVEESASSYILEVWYEGELRCVPRAYTYQNVDGRVHLFGIGEEINDNKVQMYVTRTTPEALHYDLDQALPIEPIVDRYDLTPTSYERVWVRKGSPGENALGQCQRMSKGLPVRVVVSQTDIGEEPVEMGYLSGYNLVTVSYESSVPGEWVSETIDELRGRLL